MNQITAILCELERRGDGGSGERASGQLLPLVYNELRRLASQRIAQERPGQTLQATALVHEAYLRLVQVPGGCAWNGRAHFFAAAAEAMRRILIERARRAHRRRHGGGRRRLEIDQLDPSQLTIHRASDDAASDDRLLAIDDALTRLQAEDPDAAQIVKLRYFAGLTAQEAADAMGISLRTANRHWAYAKSWLFEQLRADGDGRR
jgi:RNA polymerase sigma factor (TIGR02999 family)